MRRCLYIFSQDLRLDDNPALAHATSADEYAVLYYRDQSSPWQYQGAAAWWLEQNLASLDSTLKNHNVKLHLLSGSSLNRLTDYIRENQFNEVCVARAYFKHERAVQRELNQWCNEHDVQFKRFPGILMYEPEAIFNKQGSFYKVFTPFYKATMPLGLRPTSSFEKAPKGQPLECESETLAQWKLSPKTAKWTTPLANNWVAGEEAAHAALTSTIQNVLENYAQSRDLLNESATSRLSPYLSLGIISPTRIWEEVSVQLPNEVSQAWLRQLIWREFNYHLLFHRDDIDTNVFQEKFANYPWRINEKHLRAWQKGQTGYPIVDAAMNELWQTGWMHNRARMIVASFLTKHLQLHWLDGARWFWDTLVDADLANNSGGWQWTAGCGADAAPYFRIFNPITQGKKFDLKGEYTRKWLPVLAKLPDKYLYAPWEAPQDIRESAGVFLGENYPMPIVDHKMAREAALENYHSL